MDNSIPTILDRPDTTRAQLLKELSPQHKQILALLAQGLPRVDIAKICNTTPNYVSWIVSDPLCKQYLRLMTGFVETRMEALFEKSVDVIADGMLLGTGDEKLKAARMQLEATGRLGRSDRIPIAPEPPGHLEQLAERLVALMKRTREGVTLDGQAEQIIDINPRSGQRQTGASTERGQRQEGGQQGGGEGPVRDAAAEGQAGTDRGYANQAA